MEPDPLTLAEDAALAARLAAAAGRIGQEVRAAALLDGKALGCTGDCTVNTFLVEALSRLRPDDGLLSEERRDTPERLGKSRVWIVDPIDGTREYGECRADWAVHVGLAVDGVAVAGAVALPDCDGGTVLTSHDVTPLSAHAGPPRLLISRSRPAPEALAIAEQLGGELMPMGSAGAKAMAVVRGQADIYLHSGGQYEWDNCAPVAVAAAHGLHCSRIDGSPLRYNNRDTYLPDVLICRPQWAERVLRIVATL
ncbi:inositol phosphatase [Croceibacterium mercuriale]|uniref:Inositol phosphatase n=1 Tax=Croceibacterium mercuriale TaxID=1572751 RepID=A0A0B2BXL8_9SPHN|nr:3'(2'),5'-bisphosphate nucleotidase CysQ [Croceibacterium mercuriale]KHL24431.1 inositol phosphatase [Croceibacterium mercuriale]